MQQLHELVLEAGLARWTTNFYTAQEEYLHLGIWDHQEVLAQQKA